MKFRVGFLLGAAAGAWIATKASEIQRSAGDQASTSSAGVPEDAAEKLRALTGLARERLTGLAEGPIGNMARDRLAEVIGASLSGNRPGARNGHGPIDSTGSWND